MGMTSFHPSAQFGHQAGRTMATKLIASTVLLALTYIVYWKVSIYISTRQFRRFKEQNGLGEPPDAPGPMGFARLKRMLYASRAERLPLRIH